MMKRRVLTLSVVLLLASLSRAATAQAPLPDPVQAPLPNAAPPPARYPPAELDRVVSPIALYPDPLLAQVLAAATFSADIPDAAHWSDQHHYVTGDQLAEEIAADQLPWDPSVEALLPFPSVLGMMASAMPWTEELGTAVLAQREEVMDAVQRMRQEAAEFGYLRSNARINVSGGPYIEILPVDPAFVVVPYYNPAIVFVRPRGGYVAASVINFGFGVAIGARFAPWGWGSTRVAWRERAVIINNARWDRTWANRTRYVHPYVAPRYGAPRPVEEHRLIERSQHEREAERVGRSPREEHRRADDHKPDERRRADRKKDDAKQGDGKDEHRR